MTYKITIEKIEEKEITRMKWVEVDPYKNEKGETLTHDYREMTEPEKIEQAVYTQRTEDEIDLVAIIEAFNKKTK